MQNIQKGVEWENRLLFHPSPQPPVSFLEATIVANFSNSLHTQVCACVYIFFLLFELDINFPVIFNSHIVFLGVDIV